MRSRALLLTGADPSVLTEQVLARFRESLPGGTSGMRIVVPTKTLEQHLQNRLAREGLVFRPDRIQTLSGFTELFETGETAASEAAFQLMVEGAVVRAARPEFAKVAGMAGFHASLTRTLQDLDTAGCCADTLERNLERAPLGDALIAVWREVESEMRRRGLVTRSGALKAAAERITLRNVAETVAFDGFESFSDPELSVVKALASRSEVTVTLPDGEFSQAARNRLIAMEFEERTAGMAAANALRPAGPVSPAAPENIEREADEIARRILLASANGTPFREIGVILRNQKVYAPILESTLERFQIPARFYFEAPLSEHPVAQFIVGLMDAKLAGWDHEMILPALRLAPKTGVSSAMDRLDIEVRKGLPGRGLPNLMELAGPGDDRLLKLLDACRTQLRTGLRDLPNARDLFRPGLIPDDVPWSAAFTYRSQAAALEAIEKAIGEAAEWHASDPKPASTATVWRTAKTVLSLTPLRVPDNRRNVVHVLSAYEARQWNLSVVIVPGLIEGQFPKHHPQNAFLPDIAIAGLKNAGFRLRTSEDRESEEKFLFDSAIASATVEAILTYPRTDGHGEPNVPSTFLTAATAGEAPPKVRPAPSRAPHTSRPASAISNPELLRVLNEQHATYSASGLESFLQCPFQFFARKTLRLCEFPPRPEDRLSFPILGNLAHAFLAEWFVERPPIEPLFDRLFAKMCAKECVPAGYKTEMWRHRLLQDLKRFCEKDVWPRQGAVVETEIDFNFPLNESIMVKGRIDRLERLPDGSGIVVDYKYSPGERTRKLIGDETKLQAPIYLLAIERQFGLTPAAMAYYSLRGDPTPYGRGTVAGLSDKWEPVTRQWLDDAAAKIVESVGDLRNGRIVPAPAVIEPCRYCEARDICRYEAAAALTASGE